MANVALESANKVVQSSFLGFDAEPGIIPRASREPTSEHYPKLFSRSL